MPLPDLTVGLRRCSNKVLLAARCDEGLSLRDIMKPEKQRVQRVLSALINLFKFRAEKLAWYEENIEKKERMRERPPPKHRMLTV